jgi:hypothetical protein
MDMAKGQVMGIPKGVLVSPDLLLSQALQGFRITRKSHFANTWRTKLKPDPAPPNPHLH